MKSAGKETAVAAKFSARNRHLRRRRRPAQCTPKSARLSSHPPTPRAHTRFLVCFVPFSSFPPSVVFMSVPFCCGDTRALTLPTVALRARCEADAHPFDYKRACIHTKYIEYMQTVHMLCTSTQEGPKTAEYRLHHVRVMRSRASVKP